MAAAATSTGSITLITLSPDDVEHYREAFDQYDEAHLGALSVSDVRLAMLDVGLRMSEHELVDVLAAGTVPHVLVADGKPKPLAFKAFLELIRRVRTLKLAHAPHQGNDDGSSDDEDGDGGALPRTKSQVSGAAASRRGSRRASAGKMKSSPADGGRSSAVPSGSAARRGSAATTQLRLNIFSHWSDEMLVHILTTLEGLREAITEAQVKKSQSQAAVSGDGSQPSPAPSPTAAAGAGGSSGEPSHVLMQLELLGCPYEPTLAAPKAVSLGASTVGTAPPAAAALGVPTAPDLIRFIGAVSALISRKIHTQMQYVVAYSHDDVSVDHTSLLLASALDHTQTQDFDEERIKRDLAELEQFTFEAEKDPHQRQGSDAFKSKMREFPSFMFPTESVCARLDHLDQLHDQYEDLLAGKEFMMKPQCPDGRQCGVQDVPEHRLAFTHPCFADGPLCPHRYRHLHMKVYSHPEDREPTVAAQLREMKKRLGVLDLSGVELGDAGTQCIAHVLVRDKTRDSGDRRYAQVLMSGNHMSPVGAVPLLDACTQLTVLDLEGNSLGRKSVSAMTSSSIGPALQLLLSRADKLTHLNLAKNKLSDRDARYITESLKTNTILRHLDLRKNELGSTFGADMAAALSENRDLKELLVGWNRLESFGSSILLQELKTSSTIEVLDMSWTGVAEEGGKMIAELIVGSQAIKTLLLGHNSIGPEGTTAIAKAIAGNKSLTTLDLSFNPVGTRSCVDLIRELKENTVLELVDIRCVKAGEELLEEIKRALKLREPKLPSNAKSTVLFSTSVAALDH